MTAPRGLTTPLMLKESHKGGAKFCHSLATLAAIFLKTNAVLAAGNPTSLTNPVAQSSGTSQAEPLNPTAGSVNSGTSIKRPTAPASSYPNAGASMNAASTGSNNDSSPPGSSSILPPTQKGGSTLTLRGMVTEQQALNETLLSNPRVAGIRSLVGISRAAYVQAWTFPNPSLEFDNAYAELSYRFGVALPVEPPWKVVFRLVVAKAEVGRANLQMQQTLWALRAESRKAYTELIIAEDALVMMRELADLTARLLDVATKRFSAGDVARLDMLKAQLANSQAEVEAGQAERRVIQAREQMNIIMGHGENTPLTVPQLAAFELRAANNELMPELSRTLPPESYFIEEAMKNRLELKIVNAQIKVAKARVLATKGNLIPNGQIGFGFDKQKNDPGVELKRDYVLGSFPIPVFDLQQGEFAKLRATIRSLNFDMMAQQNLVRAQVALAYRKLVNARETIRNYQDGVLGQSKQVADMGRLSYKLGQSDITAAITAQQANIQVRNSYLTEVLNYQLAFTELEQSVGRVLQ